MNIKIKKEHHERLCEQSYIEYVFGSRLFGTNTKDSDYDYIRVYEYENMFPAKTYLPNIHSFQYDDIKNNSQYIWMTKEQFFHGLYSGDGTMQSDILMFGGHWSKDIALNTCRTYKVIKAYLGVAKRDLRLHNTDNKLFHANRSYHIANSLVDNVLPKKEDIIKLKNNLLSKDNLLPLINKLRVKVNVMYEQQMLENYFVPSVGDDLLQIMLDANNTREFRYE